MKLENSVLIDPPSLTTKLSGSSCLWMLLDCDTPTALSPAFLTGLEGVAPQWPELCLNGLFLLSPVCGNAEPGLLVWAAAADSDPFRRAPALGWHYVRR